MPGGHLYDKLGRFYALQEATYGTDSVTAQLVANTTAMTYWDMLSVNITANVDRFDNPRVRGSGDSEADSHIIRNQTVSLTGALTGAINVGTTEYTHWRDAMLAAGMSETLVATTSATYKPSTTAQLSMSCINWIRGAESYKFRAQQALGVRGNISFAFSLNTPATWTFEGQSNNLPESADTANYQQGISEELAFFAADGTVALRPDTGAAVTYAQTETYGDDPKFLPTSLTLTLDSQTLQASSISYNMNREVAVVEEITGTTNVAKVLSLPGTPTIDVVLTESAAGYEKVLALAKSGNEVAFTHVQGLGSGNDQFTATANKVQVDASGPVRQANGSIIGHSFRLFCRGDYASSILGDNSISFLWNQVP